MHEPKERIAQLTDVLGILEDSRSGVSAVEIAMSLGFTRQLAEEILQDLREVFLEIESEHRSDGEYFSLAGQRGTGAPELAPEIEWVRAHPRARLDASDLENSFPR